MQKSAQYQERIRKLGTWKQLHQFWIEVVEGTDNDEWPPGIAFEYLILRAFELDQAIVRYPFSVNLFEDDIEQIDGVVHTGTVSALIECKNTGSPLNVESIAKMRNQLQRRPSSAIGCLFSTGGFTSPAITLAHFLAPQTILLWEKDEVNFVLENGNITEALKTKLRYCIETGQPNFKPQVKLFTT